MKIINVIKCLFHSYNYIHELDVSELSDEELEMLISEILDIEEVSSALDELYKRKPDIAFDLSKSIVEEEKGDIYLQALIIRVKRKLIKMNDPGAEPSASPRNAPLRDGVSVSQ